MMPLWFFFAMIAVGLIVGSLAHSVVPQISVAGTVTLGLAGAILGGLMGWLFVGTAFGLFFAIVGGCAVIYVRDRFVEYR